jgi:hypothetical protein
MHPTAQIRVPQLILVGGFLGAGKTTLIVRAAELLRLQGVRAAVITNDQDDGLVDTHFTEARAIPTREVAGGCFCCRFSLLMDAADQLRRYAPDVIFAEPVGSCIDLSATILQPLKAYHQAEYAVAPLTVLVDPEAARGVFAGEADENVSFLFLQQLAEADLLCVSKMDRQACPALPVPVDFQLSAVTGQGIAEWLEAVRSGSRVAGARLLDVDYGRYAEAEAALGWINVQAGVVLRQALSPAMLAGPLVDDMEARLWQAGITIAHLKVFDRCATGFLKVSVCRHGETPQADGDLAASPGWHHELVINLRALGDPAELLALVHRALAGVEGEIAVRHTGAFRPPPPQPEHRFTLPG